MKIKTRTVDLSKILKNYHDEWLTLTPDSSKVIANGKDANKVLEESWKKGFKSPVLMRAPKNWGAYIL